MKKLKFSLRINPIVIDKANITMIKQFEECWTCGKLPCICKPGDK